MLRSLPIFPLNTVLYPGALLPLKIFEQRYLDMTKACVRDASAFGVCRIREGQEVGAPAIPDAVGCAATILEWEMPHLGLFHLRTRGEGVFRIVRQDARPDGLIQADVEVLDDTPGTVRVEAFSLCRRVLEQVVEKIGADYFPGPLLYDDPRWTSYRLAEVLPLGGAEKQALLEIREDGARLDRLCALLNQAG